MHFTVEVGAREGRFGGNQRIVVIQKSQLSGGIERLDFRATPLAKGTGSIQEDVILCRLGQCDASGYITIMAPQGGTFAVEKFETRNYRNRPGGSADGGMCGVEDGVPEFAETLEGAGWGSPMPTFIS